MAEMRLVVAGAGGRMGRTLVKAIADNEQFALAGALEDARSPLIGWDAGTLAGLGENDIKLDRRRRPADGAGRRHHRFHHSGRHHVFAALAAKAARSTSSAPPA